MRLLSITSLVSVVRLPGFASLVGVVRLLGFASLVGVVPLISCTMFQGTYFHGLSLSFTVKRGQRERGERERNEAPLALRATRPHTVRYIEVCDQERGGSNVLFGVHHAHQQRGSPPFSLTSAM